jgi:hypothetical protein
MRLGIFLILPLLVAAHAFGVSRIGGGKVSSQESGFALEMASPFLTLDQYGNSVLAQGPMAIAQGRNISQYVQVSEFADFFKNLKSEARDGVRNFFAKNAWDPVPSPNACVEIYTYANTSATGTVLIWGADKGVVLQGPATPQVLDAIQKTANSLQLQPGACAWK